MSLRFKRDFDIRPIGCGLKGPVDNDDVFSRSRAGKGGRQRAI